VMLDEKMGTKVAKGEIQKEKKEEVFLCVL
jgi:hypothetical protein